MQEAVFEGRDWDTVAFWKLRANHVTMDDLSVEVLGFSDRLAESHGQSPRPFLNCFWINCLERERGRDRETERERERERDLLFHLFLHSLVDSCMCPDQGLNPQP